MFEKISQRSEALDDLIDEFAEGIKDAYGISEFGDPHFSSDDSIYAVGRILSGQTDSAKVTASSLFLESSRLQGAGKRIGLRFAPGVKVRGGAPGVKGFGLFPGCLVCAKGRNGGGGVFVVEEVLMVSRILTDAYADGSHLHRHWLRLLPQSCWTINTVTSYADSLFRSWLPLDHLRWMTIYFINPCPPS
jgi:hypothetical protein